MRRLPIAAAALCAVLALPAPAGAAMRFRACGDFGFSCSRLTVPLDRSGSAPGTVSLYVKRLRSARRRTGATFVVAGGPGQSATATFEGDGLGQLFPAYRNRDLIVLDQRGTGRSGVLRCRGLERANLLDAGRAAANCAAALGGRRRFYTTADSVEDIEAVRRELGVARIALLGISYGAKVAVAYAHRHPENVERIVLDSVVEPEGPDTVYVDTLAAVPRVLRTLCRSGCDRITPDPVADVQRLVTALGRRPLRGRIVDARGRRRAARLERGDVFLVLLAGDFDPSLRAAFPGAVRSALDGDAAPLLRLARRGLEIDAEPPPPRELSVALYAATSCEELDFPWDRGSPPAERRRQAEAFVARMPDSTFHPFDRATALESDFLTLCEHWPAGPAPPPLASGPAPDVPLLLLEGEDDLRTPVENARRVAAGFRQSTLLVAPDTGHSVIGSDPSGCSSRALSRFFLGGPMPSRCPRGQRQFPPLPVAPRSLAAVEPARGLRGARGRAIAALALTLRDVADDALAGFIFDERDPDLARGGGLRAGRYRVDGNGVLRLYRVQYVPGVRVSGRIRAFGERRQRGRIHVSGRATPDGILRIRGNVVRGRLGGKWVRSRLRPPAALARARRAVALPAPAAR